MSDISPEVVNAGSSPILATEFQLIVIERKARRYPQIIPWDLSQATNTHPLNPAADGK